MIQFLFLFSLNAFAEKLDYEVVDMKVKGFAIKVKIADTGEKREHGLMFVKAMPTNEGMLFIFPEEQILNFWMKNTLIPLSIGFFDHNGELLDTQEMKPAISIIAKPPTYESSGPAVFALEMNENWFPKHSIKPGAKLELSGKTKSTLLSSSLPKKPVKK